MASSTVRKRDVGGNPSNEAMEGDEIPTVEDDEDELLSQSMKPPPEDELWGDSATMTQVKLGGKQHNIKRAKKLRKTILETGIRMAVHMAMLALYIAIHVYFDDQYKKCPPELRMKYFYGGIPFGGLWKYMTHICMVRT